MQPLLQRSGVSLIAGTAAMFAPPVQKAVDTHISALNRTLVDARVVTVGLAAAIESVAVAGDKIVNARVFAVEEVEAMKTVRAPAEFYPMAAVSAIGFAVMMAALIMTFVPSVAEVGKSIGIFAMIVACFTGARAAALIQQKR